MAKTRWFRPADAIPALLCIAVVTALFVILYTADTGQTVLIKTPTGETRLSLAEDTERVFVGKDGLKVIVTVRDGAVAVTSATCPDQVCVQTGRLTKSGASAVCVPAEITVTVMGDDAPDAVVR